MAWYEERPGYTSLPPNQQNAYFLGALEALRQVIGKYGPSQSYADFLEAVQATVGEIPDVQQETLGHLEQLAG